MGTPRSMDFRLLSLSTLLTYDCQNTSQGPSVLLKFNGCRIPPRDHYVSWQFIDLPWQPAAAVGFQFNLTAKQHGDDKHVSFVSGTTNSDNFTDDNLETFRGRDSNVLKIQLFPQTYINHHNLKLLQPLVQDFTQGSTFLDVTCLNASLQNPMDGIINTTLSISSLSNYIVEISNENVLGPVSILASIGGLYAFSVSIFLCLMDQTRKFVMYTWANLDPSDRSGKWPEGSVMDSLHVSFHKKRKPIRRATSNGNNAKKDPDDMDKLTSKELGKCRSQVVLDRLNG